MSRYSNTEVKPFDGVSNVAHKVAMAKFSVGKGGKAELSLFTQDAANVAVFEVQPLGRRCRLASLQQIGGPEEAADMISANIRGPAIALLIYIYEGISMGRPT